MKNSDYWKQRFDQVEQSANNKSVRYVKQLEKKYQTAAQQIDTQINAWYSRIAKNNEVSITDAKTLLSKSELKEFKWTVKDYIKYGQENSIDQAWMKELENASAKFHINRLEALKLECRQQIEVALANGQETMFDTLADVYKDSFYKSCFEVQKGIGVGFDVSKLDNNQVSRILNKPWSVDGTNFSAKLWGNKRKLINTLDQELSRMVLTGEAPNKTIQSIKKAMDTSLYNAKRLVLTEQAYFTTLGQKDAFGELDVEEYEIVATLDNRTSDKCQEMDGQHFPVKDMQPGLNAPPFHVFCRSTTCPYFNDEFTVNDKRVAKNEETGEWYEVPANMTYKEWDNIFVKGGSKDDLTPIVEDDIVEVSKKEFVPANTIKEAEEYARTLGVSTVSFKGADINVANAMNKSLTNALDYSPEIKDNMNFFGVTQERNKLLKADLESYFDKWYRNKYPNKTDEWYKTYAKKSASRSVGKVGTNNWATAFSGKVSSTDQEIIEIFKKYSGIGVNGKAAKDSEEFLRNLKYSVESKFHPIGCDTIESVFDHEFGHQLDYAFDLSNDSEIKDLWNNFRKNSNAKCDELLSTYAYRDGKIQEFIAEAYSEYLNNNNPRDIANAIGQIIEKKVK